MSDAAAYSPGRRSIFTRLYHGETDFDFVHRWRLWFAISGAIVAIGVGSLALRGLNFGLEFEGGTSWEVRAPGVTVAEVRDALDPLGLGGAKIQTVGSDSIRVQAEPGEGEGEAEAGDITEAIADLAGVSSRAVTVNEVGPSWGNEITNKAQRALFFFLIAITIYISLRFEWKMAIATLSALFHDILVTVSVYSITGFEVTPATVIAILTILGYSIYDGIVVFDKVEENTRGLAASGRMTFGDMVNVSLNQVLMRSLNTSITALLPILSLLVIGARILGAVTIAEFAVALLIGLGASAYSSIFIASPLLALLKEREPRYAAIRDRLAGRGGAVLTPAGPAPSAAPGAPPTSEATPPRARQAPVTAPPRARKKGRRR